MPLQATSGAASYDAFGGGVASVPQYIEDVFSTYLYTGNSSTQTITNGIDLSGKGGMVWTGRRTTVNRNTVYDTARTLGGFPAELRTMITNAQAASGSISSFNSNGYSLTSDIDNTSGASFASWTFRKQPKFFDIVTYTGNGLQNSKTIPHNLGSVPGAVIIKAITDIQQWVMYHRSIPSLHFLRLNTTAVSQESGQMFRQPPDANNIYVGDDQQVNVSGVQYVAYVFAHNAGGFGLSGTDNVISCGSYTGSASDITINLGYEVQWVLVKNTTQAANWQVMDIMRGMPLAGTAKTLAPNLSDAESSPTAPVIVPTATGMTITGGLGYALNYEGDSYIYIAIRRGPMKVPTSGTSVFAPTTYTGDDGSNREITGLSFTPDLMLNAMRLENGSGRSPSGFYWFDRLRGKGARLRSSQALAEFLVGPAYEGVNFRSYSVDAASGESNYNPALYVSHLFKRAPSFFDVVCYTGNGQGANNQIHNLGVMPEMCILRRRSSAANWQVVHKNDGVTAASLALNVTNATIATSVMSANFTSTYFKTSDGTCWYEATNGNTSTFVAYLFATLAGVSKVGSYTGTATTLQIDCGFTGGARFVLIKRTDLTGDWYVWDSARGIVAGNDHYLLLNSTAAEVTGTDYVDTYSAGFEISSTAPAAINASGGTYIFLAIA